MGNLVAGGSSGRRRASRFRPFVPQDARDLLAAVAAARAGEDSALVRWERDARPVLWRALRRSGFDPASADDAIIHLLEQADRAVRAGRRIAHETAWMSAVLGSARRARRRSAQRAEAAHRRLAAHRPQTYEPQRPEELREELLVAARRLRPRFALAIRLRLRGFDAREARAALCVELAVGAEQARRIDRCSIAAMRAALAGRDASAEAAQKNRGIQYQIAPGPASSL